jgi:membrane fusion protein (multidrug efflux system)
MYVLARGVVIIYFNCKNNMIRIPQFSIPGLRLGLILMVTCWACSSKEPAQTESAGKFKVITPAFLDTTYSSEYVAEINSVQNVEIRSRLKGFIDKIHVDEGSWVSAGQILFTLDNRGYKEDLLKSESQLKSAIAELKHVEVELANAQMLVQKKIISAKEIDMLKAKKEMAEAKIQEAKASIATAQHNLAFTMIKAPFSGYINRIPNKRGSLVDEGELLTTLSDNSEVLAYFNVSETDYLDYMAMEDKSSFRSAALLLANNEPYPHKGRIDMSETEFDKATGNIAFRVRFPNPDKLLKHGANGKVVLHKKLQSAMVIPQRSTFEVQDKLFVFVIDSTNTTRQREITPSLRLPHLFVVEQGLAKNERILLEGVEGVKDGQKIQAEILPSAELAIFSDQKK